MSSIKLLIADDHPLIAEGIKNIFEDSDSIEVIGVVNNGIEVLEFVKAHLVDIILLDVEMPQMNGIECAKKLLSDNSDTKIMMLTMHQEVSLVKNLIDIGVKGYMLKTIPKEELVMAVKKVFNGSEHFSSDITKALLSGGTISKTIRFTEKSELLNLLTSREIEIISLITEGLSNPQIGKKLFISPRTVDSHRTNIMKKLDIHNVAGLIRFAFQNDLA